MQPTPEIDAFIARIEGLPTGPGVSLDAALQPSLEEEAELRKLFVSDRQSARLANPHVGLVDVFDAPDAIRATRARVVKGKKDLSTQYVMPIKDEDRRKEGAPSMVADLEEFKKNWAIFSEGSLSQLLDWNNVVAAGGSVLASLSPLDEEHKKSKRAIRKYYHSKAYPTSDVDLFLWGMNAEQAEAKVKQIYEAVRDSVPWDVTCIRTKHTVSIHSQYPYRSVQIVLRLYHSPAEILAGFDIDAPCCAYDGNRVWANPRAVVAMMRQCNTVDMTRRSPSYEVRLSKYSQRSYEVYVPTLARDKVDPTIYERAIAKMEGLARLLVLEKLKDDNMRASFLEDRRTLRGRPGAAHRSYGRYNRRRYKGDLKEETGLGLEMNDYDVTTLHIPYGPGWDAKRIDKLIYQTDLGMNSTFNPKNKGRRLHRHAAFFGTVEECIEDCCENCPDPIDQDERDLQKDEDEVYVRGRIQFMEENPGRQSMTGSFNPIDEGEWSEQVYMRPTEQFFQAIAAHDRPTVQRLLKTIDDKTGGLDINHRDHVGRTCLHVALISNAEDIAMDLINAGARITARLADGRTPLHLAAQYDHTAAIKKLFEKSGENKKAAEKGEAESDEVMDTKGGPERPSSEDDWSSHDDEDVVMTDPDDGDDEDDEEGSDDGGNKDGNGDKADETQEAAATGDIPEDEEAPDIIDSNMADFDFGFTALCFAVLFASAPTVESLLAAGADAKLPTKITSGCSAALHPLSLTLLREDDEVSKIVECLLKAGATSSTADEQMRTILHFAVSYGHMKVVETILRCDPNAKAALDFPQIQYQTVMFPLATAVQKKNYSILALLLAYGVKVKSDEADVTRAMESLTAVNRGYMFGHSQVRNYLDFAYQPVELALKQHDEVAKLLIAIGATVDVGIKKSLNQYDASSRQSVRDWVNAAIVRVDEIIEEKEEAKLRLEAVFVMPKDAVPDVEIEAPKTSWMKFYVNYQASLVAPIESDTAQTKMNRDEVRANNVKRASEEIERIKDLKAYLVEVQNALIDRQAKTWSEIYPDIECKPVVKILKPSKPDIPDVAPVKEKEISKPQRRTKYVYLAPSYSHQTLPEHLLEAYDDLYQACYDGDNEKVQRLCLPIPGQPAAPGAPSPLRITVRMMDVSAYYYSSEGYTPLFAAIAGRRWSTAKLILAIATAQYQPDDDDDQIKFDVNVMDDDSDDESCHSDDSDITVAQKPVTFVDIATRPSEVRCNVHPQKLLDQQTPWRKPKPAASEPALVGPENGSAPPITKAIVDHDLQAFVHIANLYESLPQPIPLPSYLLSTICQQDQPDILDEYIRRTGAGIDLAGAQKESGHTEPIQTATNDGNKIYLGLNVHGKKRVDLARKNDPNASFDNGTVEKPALWTAIQSSAKAVITYFASDRPLAAYKFFATTHTDAKALWLKRLGTDVGGELEKRLPSWLGWIVDALGESPLSVAIVNKDLNVIKLLAKLEPKLIAQALQTNIKFLGVNPLQVAVRLSADTKVVDYLLSRKVSPGEKDLIRGWNIYHYICEKDDAHLLQFFLDKLPRDLNESLLAQKSKLRGNTPLHIAVKSGCKRLVELIVAYSKNSILLQDVDGRAPLHCAVVNSFSSIVKTLVAAAPDALTMENGVGNTPLEIASLKDLIQRVSNFTTSSQQGRYSQSGDELRPNGLDVEPRRIQISLIEKYEAELEETREVMGTMLDQAAIAMKEKEVLKMELTKWLNRVTEMVRIAKESEAPNEAKRQKEAEVFEKKDKAERYPQKDSADISETLGVIHEYLKTLSDGGSSIRRQLIHLLDVQKSVGATLIKVTRGEVGDDDGYQRFSYRRRRQYEDEEELQEEVDEEVKMKNNSMVIQCLGTSKDNF